MISLLVVAPVHAAQKGTTGNNDFIVTYLKQPADAYYKERRGYAGLQYRLPRRPLRGVKMGINESKVLGRSMGLKFILEEADVDSIDAARQVIRERVAQQGAAFVLLDLPMEQFQSVVAGFRSEPVLFFNARHQQDILRASNCSGKLFHTIASNAMLNDGLAQFLKSRNWNRVLILQGPQESDEELVKAFTQSAKKFKLKIVDNKPFVLSNNPRDRDRTNIPLLTSNPKHEVLFIADSFGEFARYVPYHTYAPTLIVGSEGLIPAAWHWTWERHGAPQLNQRFSRSVSRALKKQNISASATATRMSSPEWAGWAAVKSLVASVTGSKSTEIGAIADYLLSDRLTLDMYKGTSGSFRSWNGQLRQPVLLHTHNAVVDRAPIDGFMHHENNLDTLGQDRHESECVE